MAILRITSLTLLLTLCLGALHGCYFLAGAATGAAAVEAAEEDDDDDD